MTNQTFLHIDIVLKCIESGVFYCPAFFRGGNNDPASTFVLESMGACELIPIPGTNLYIYGLCQETNLKHTILHGFSYGMASASVRRSRLATAALVQK